MKKFLKTASLMSSLFKCTFICILAFSAATTTFAKKTWNGSFWVLEMDKDTSLGSNLTGIVAITKNSVIFDLNGYTITSPATQSYVGINLQGYHWIEINGPGTIENFNTGVYINGGDGNTLHNFEVTGCNTGVYFDNNSNSNMIDNVNSHDNDEIGFLLYGNYYTQVYNSIGRSNGLFGVWNEGSLYTDISYSTMDSNGVDGITLNQGYYATMEDGGNYCCNNGRHGLYLYYTNLARLGEYAPYYSYFNSNGVDGIKAENSQANYFEKCFGSNNEYYDLEDIGGSNSYDYSCIFGTIK